MKMKTVTTTTNNKNSTPKVRNSPKPAQNSKRKEKLEKQKKTVTQLRGFWTKFAEDQKLKKAREEELSRKTRKTSEKETEGNKLPTETTIRDKVHCKPTMDSCKQVQSNKFIPEHSTRPAKARIKLKSETNYSGDLDKNKISK